MNFDIWIGWKNLAASGTLFHRSVIIKMVYKLPFNTSDSNDVCWWTLDGEATSIPINDTTFAYSDTECYIAGVIFAFQSIVGAVLNFLLIIALLWNFKLRKEYLTKTIVSMPITDFLWSVYFLPQYSLYFFQK